MDPGRDRQGQRTGKDELTRRVRLRAATRACYAASGEDRVIEGRSSCTRPVSFRGSRS